MANHTIVFQTPLCDGTEVKIKFNPIPDPLVEKHNEERFNFVSMCLCNFERGVSMVILFLILILDIEMFCQSRLSCYFHVVKRHSS